MSVIDHIDLGPVAHARQAIAGGVLVLDQVGRWWCQLGRHGFTFVDGQWWWGTHAELITRVTTPATVTALDLWYQSHLAGWSDPDPTPSAGIPVPGSSASLDGAGTCLPAPAKDSPGSPAGESMLSTYRIGVLR